MNSIKVLFTEQEQQNLLPGRYYIGVRVKIPTVIVSSAEDIPDIPPSLDPDNSPYHFHPDVVLSETHFVIFDITDHPQVPAERTTEAADRFLAEHYPELDRALRNHLRNLGQPDF